MTLVQTQYSHLLDLCNLYNLYNSQFKFHFKFKIKMIIPNAKKKKKKQPPRPACCDLPWPLWPHLLCSLSIPYSAYTVGLLVMPQQARHTPNPNLGPLHWPFPKPGLLHPRVAIGCSLTSFKSLPKCQLFSESISTHLFKNHNPLWYSV